MNAAINGKKLLKNLAIPLAGGTLVGLLTKNGVQIFNETAKKPVFMPPGWLFPVAWTILYTLMGIAAYQIDDAENTPEQKRALLLYYVQLAMNLLWSFLFFGGRIISFIRRICGSEPPSPPPPPPPLSEPQRPFCPSQPR